MNSKKVSVTKCKHDGVMKFRVRWHEGDRVKRAFHLSRSAAETQATELRGAAVGVRQLLAHLSQADQEKLVMLFNEAKRRDIDLLELLNVSQPETTAAPAIADVLSEMETAKRKAGRAEDYLNSLRHIIEAFYKGQDRLPIDKFTVADIEKYLDSKNLESRSTLRARLSTLFKFAVRRRYRLDNPCAQLEAISVAFVTPSILTVEETEKCLAWLKLNPRLLAWFALSTFAGLRPEEAEQTTWADIHFDEGWVKVEAQTTKIRQRRVVYPMRMAMEWLKEAQKLKSLLPLTVKQRTIERNKLRAVLGWEKWKQDCTRHTASSYWLAHTGEAAKIADALGHSEKIMRKHYKALVTKAEAKKFWKLSASPAPDTSPAPDRSKGKKRPAKGRAGSRSAAPADPSPRHRRKNG